MQCTEFVSVFIKWMIISRNTVTKTVQKISTKDFKPFCSWSLSEITVSRKFWPFGETILHDTIILMPVFLKTIPLNLKRWSELPDIHVRFKNLLPMLNLNFFGNQTFPKIRSKAKLHSIKCEYEYRCGHTILSFCNSHSHVYSTIPCCKDCT